MTTTRDEILTWVLLAVFGLATGGSVPLFDAAARSRLDLLVLAAGNGALITAMVWFFVLGARRSALWGVAMLVPYVNFIAASSFARRHWREGARAPALLAIAGMLLQTLGAVRLLLAPLPPLV